MEEKIYRAKLVFGETCTLEWLSIFSKHSFTTCLMTAQIANGGFEIKPRIIFNKNNNLREYIKYKNENPNDPLPTDLLVSNLN